MLFVEKFYQTRFQGASCRNTCCSASSGLIVRAAAFRPKLAQSKLLRTSCAFGEQSVAHINIGYSQLTALNFTIYFIIIRPLVLLPTSPVTN